MGVTSIWEEGTSAFREEDQNDVGVQGLDKAIAVRPICGEKRRVVFCPVADAFLGVVHFAQLAAYSCAPAANHHAPFYGPVACGLSDGSTGGFEARPRPLAALRAVHARSRDRRLISRSPGSERKGKRLQRNSLRCTCT